MNGFSPLHFIFTGDVVSTAATQDYVSDIVYFLTFLALVTLRWCAPNRYPSKAGIFI
jgi:hypothetical protein